MGDQPNVTIGESNVVITKKEAEETNCAPVTTGVVIPKESTNQTSTLESTQPQQSCATSPQILDQATPSPTPQPISEQAPTPVATQTSPTPQPVSEQATASLQTEITSVSTTSSQSSSQSPRSFPEPTTQSCSVPLNPGETLLKEGYLTKKGIIRKNWKKRWFALVKAPFPPGSTELLPHLRYYKKKGSNQVIGEVILNRCSSVYCVEGDKKHKFRFNVLPRHRTGGLRQENVHDPNEDREYKFEASTKEEMEDWVRVLENAIFAAPESSIKYAPIIVEQSELILRDRTEPIKVSASAGPPIICKSGTKVALRIKFRVNEKLSGCKLIEQYNTATGSTTYTSPISDLAPREKPFDVILPDREIKYSLTEQLVKVKMLDQNGGTLFNLRFSFDVKIM